jgi:DNA helicase II / ATP-dependent DNA helicase PcrA
MPELTSETKRILDIVRQGHSFLLSGGAGSGKTYSLVEVIRAIAANNPSTSIACITYTNAAADEIRDRAKSDTLWVSTIHDFMWDNIKRYQTELKCVLIDLIISDDPAHKRFNLPDNDSTVEDLFTNLPNGIQYREYVRIKDGIISHDDVLVLASRMFELYPKLSRIVKDRYRYILVDEYQDTSPLVVTILLDHFKNATNLCVVGFFGDAMQAIYPGTVGNLKDRVENGELQEVKKEQNRRNPDLVIALANRLRIDGLTQRPSDDAKAPNMIGGKVREGTISFLYSSEPTLDPVRQILGWDGDGVKELNLTHNLIASQAGFNRLMEIYDRDKILEFVKRIKNYIRDNPGEIDTNGMTFGEVVDTLQEGKTGSALNKVNPTATMRTYIESHPSAMQTARETLFDNISKLYISKDQLLDDAKDSSDTTAGPASQRDDLIKHLYRIQNCINAYRIRNYGEFFILTDYSIQSARDKAVLRDALAKITTDQEMTIGDVIEQADTDGLIQIDDRLIRFQEDKEYVYNQVVQLPFAEFQRLYDYLEGNTPFSTQHKTKGREYPRVLVILDNGGWNNYNFEYLFAGGGSDSVRERTAKIFYVCCTRAMEELAVFYHNPPATVISQAKEWFGKENVVNIDELLSN